MELRILNKERKERMMHAAIMLAHAPIDTLSTEDFNVMKKNTPIIGGFICGVRWADKNPESPWVSVIERMPESSIPKVSDQSRSREQIKVMVMLMDGNIMQATRRMGLNGIWYFNIPIRMRDQITHWMPIPPVPPIIDDLT